MSDKLKKILSGIGVLAAFGLGGAAIAGAQGDKSVENAAASQQGNAQSAAGEQDEAGERSESDQEVTGGDADRAGKAALQTVGGGKVVEVERETPEQEADRPEPGEKPDSAAEQAIDAKTAYSVEVRKSDGSTVDVALDDAFAVLGTEKGDHQEGQHEDGETATETAGR